MAGDEQLASIDWSVLFVLRRAGSSLTEVALRMHREQYEALSERELLAGLARLIGAGLAYQVEETFGVTAAGAVAAQEEKDRRNLAHRREVLALPMVALRRHDYLWQDNYLLQDEPVVGIGPDNTALTLGRSQHSEDLWELTRYDGSGRLSQDLRRYRNRTYVTDSLKPDFVQPLPDGGYVAVERWGHGDNAEKRDGDGRLVTRAAFDIGIAHVLSTAAGSVWVTFFDEGVSKGKMPWSQHGMARFSSDLTLEWMYGSRPSPRTPSIYSAEACNVMGETVYVQTDAGEEFLALAVVRAESRSSALLGTLRDLTHGRPHRLLIDGDRGAFIGGYDGGNDVIMPVRFTGDGVVEPDGPLSRLVLPDGMELQSTREYPVNTTCRGTELHIVTGRDWCRLSLNDIPRAS